MQKQNFKINETMFNMLWPWPDENQPSPSDRKKQEDRRK